MMKKMMRMLMICLMALSLLLSCVPSLAEDAADPVPDFFGRWTDQHSGRAHIHILPSYLIPELDDADAMVALASWGSSARTETRYRMTVRYDAAEGALQYQDGEIWEETWDGQGKSVSRVSLAHETAGRLWLEDDGVLRWADSTAAQAADCRFVQDPVPAPTPQELAEGYFRVVSRLETGAAGATLKAAQAACALMRFTVSQDIWCTDGAALKENLRSAFSLLTPDEQAAFDENYIPLENMILSVFGLSDDPMDEALFADAGLADVIADLRAAGPEAALSAETMLAAVATLENTDGEE